MTTAQLIHHLLYLLIYSQHARYTWIHHFRRELPGMPRGWYVHYSRALISDYPRQMLRILRGQPSDL